MTWGGSQVRILYRAPVVDTEQSNPTEQANYTGAIITVLVIVAVIYFFDLEAVKGWVVKAGPWAPLVFIFLKVLTIVVAPLSGSPLYPLVGLLFGFWPGILYVGLGDFIGYTIAFCISRLFGKKVVDRFISNKEEGILAKMVTHVGTPRGFFHACLTLFAMPELLAYGAGLSRLPYPKFIFIIMPLSLIASSLLVFFGSILSITSQSAYIGFAVPILGAIAIMIGGYFFTKEVVK